MGNLEDFFDFLTKVIDFMGIRWAISSHSGRYRGNNEDSCAIVYDQTISILDSKCGVMEGVSPMPVLAIVSDGLGGANNGEIASKIAVTSLAETFEQICGSGSEWDRVLREAFVFAHKSVNSKAVENPESQGMGATLSALFVNGNSGVLAHVGDSRIYLFRGGRLVQLTDDQSEVWRLFQSGLISEEDVARHPRRSVIDQAIGGGVDEVPHVQLEKLQVKSGDRFILCSDGLVEVLTNSKLEKLMRGFANNGSPPRELVEDLTDQALEASGKDNVSLVICEIGGRAEGLVRRLVGRLRKFARID